MKLWLLLPRTDLNKDDNPWEPWYDKAIGFVVRADTEVDARRIANTHGGDETGLIRRDVYRTGGDPWLTANWSTCEELAACEGEAGLVLRDYSAA